MKNTATENKLDERLNQAIELCVKRFTSAHPLKEAYLYAVLPAGKLFRPKLVWNTFLDLDPINAKNILDDRSQFLTHPITYLATAIELHHAYTLVHDDLPAMDNDLIRRGKPSVHAQYGQWQAILIGDGLLNMSYQLLAQIEHPQALNVFKIFSHATGAKGLIEGQVLDLSKEMNLSLENLLRTHELKTARLIQSSLSLSVLLSTEDKEKACHFWRLGMSLGVLFQLLDDLMELTDKELSIHEQEVNPFLKYFSRTYPVLIKEWLNIKLFFSNKKLLHLENMIENYLLKNSTDILSNENTILMHIENAHKLNQKTLTENDRKQFSNFLKGNLTF